MPAALSQWSLKVVTEMLRETKANQLLWPFLKIFGTSTKKFSLQHILSLIAGDTPHDCFEKISREWGEALCLTATCSNRHITHASLLSLRQHAGFVRGMHWESPLNTARSLVCLDSQNGSFRGGKQNLNKVAIKPSLSVIVFELNIYKSAGLLYSLSWATQRHSLWVKMMMIYLDTNLLGGLSDFDYTSLFMQSLQIVPSREKFM